MTITASNSGYKPLSSQEIQLTQQDCIEPRSVPSGQGIQWIREAWKLFKAQPWQLIAFAVAGILTMALSNFVPPSSVFLTPLLIAGFVWVSAKLDRGENIQFSDLIEPAKTQPIPLLILGAIILVSSLLAALIVGMGAGIALQAMNSTSMGLLALSAAVLMVGIIVLTLAMFSVAHAPCLIVFQGMAPKQAFKTAILAMVRNWKPMTLYGIVLLGLYILAIIPAGLGLLILWPLTLVSTYTSYKDIFQP